MQSQARRPGAIETDVVIVGAGPGGPVPGFRARPARDQGAPRRLARRPGRPVHRALSRQADLRHPGVAGLRRPGTDRPAAAADRALQRAPSSRPGSHARCSKRDDGRFDVETIARHALPRQDGGHRGRRRLVPAAPLGAKGATNSKARHVIYRVRDAGRLRRQEPRDLRRRRFGARLGARFAGKAPQGRQRHAYASPRGFAAAPASVAKMRALCDATADAVRHRQVTGFAAHRRRCSPAREGHRRRRHARSWPPTTLLVFFGLHPKLGPIAEWGLELEKAAQGRHREIPDQRARHLCRGRHQHLSGQEEADPVRLPRSGAGGLRRAPLSSPTRSSSCSTRPPAR